MESTEGSGKEAEGASVFVVLHEDRNVIAMINTKRLM